MDKENVSKSDKAPPEKELVLTEYGADSKCGENASQMISFNLRKVLGGRAYFLQLSEKDSMFREVKVLPQAAQPQPVVEVAGKLT